MPSYSTTILWSNLSATRNVEHFVEGHEVDAEIADQGHEVTEGHGDRKSHLSPLALGQHGIGRGISGGADELEVHGVIELDYEREVRTEEVLPHHLVEVVDVQAIDHLLHAAIRQHAGNVVACGNSLACGMPAFSRLFKVALGIGETLVGYGQRIFTGGFLD